MASLGKNRGQFSLDYTTLSRENKTTTTILHSDLFDGIIQNLDTAYEYEIGFVPPGYEHRPDLISNVFYGSPRNWWLLMLVNGINDPFEGFYVGQRILIPKIQ